MRLRFLGANRQVTGSRYCLEVAGLRLMIDCGMFQERPFLSRNWEPCPIPAGDLDALLLTHAHLDHCGLIPRLVHDGFSGPIHCTAPTAALAQIILTDSAKIQAEDAAYKRKRHARENRQPKHPEVALYDHDDVEKTVSLFERRPYHEPFYINDSVQATFWDAGHILGSAIVELNVDENGKTHRILFSGDIGQWDKPFIRDPQLFDRADFVVMESTYGDRTHEAHADIETHLERVISTTVSRGGNVIIPTFAVERAQEVLYYISRLVHDDRIPDIKVFLDSPMAIDVTEIFRGYSSESAHVCFDQDTWDLITAKEPPLRFPGLEMTRTPKESKAINSVEEPSVIMASSGMCTAGRIKHHLRSNIERPESTVLFVGYQGHGTLGRQILDGRERVRIHGRDYRVRAQVDQIFGFSGHADQPALLRWFDNLSSDCRQVFLTHGDEEAAAELAALIRERSAAEAKIPAYLDSVVLH